MSGAGEQAGWGGRAAFSVPLSGERRGKAGFQALLSLRSWWGASHPFSNPPMLL